MQDLTLVEQQEEAELRERQRIRREEADRVRAAEEAARKAAEPPKALPHTKEESCTVVAAAIRAEKAISIVTVNDDSSLSRTTHKKVVSRVSRAEHEGMQTLLRPSTERTISEVFGDAGLAAVQREWGLRTLDIEPNRLIKALWSLDGKSGLTVKMHALLSPVAKRIRGRLRRVAGV